MKNQITLQWQTGFPESDGELCLVEVTENTIGERFAVDKCCSTGPPNNRKREWVRYYKHNVVRYALLPPCQEEEEQNAS